MNGTVLIVDDHEEFRSAARALLEADGFCVVGEAGDGGSAIAAAELLCPEVVLLDIHLPDLDGFAVADLLVGGPQPTPTIVLTSSRPVSAFRHRLADSPVAGFLTKSELSGAALASLLTRDRDEP